jgi:hypothetical protein
MLEALHKCVLFARKYEEPAPQVQAFQQLYPTILRRAKNRSYIHGHHGIPGGPC